MKIKYTDILVPIFLTGIVILNIFPVFPKFDKLMNNDDFLQFAARHHIARETVLQSHQVPLRTHFLGGGFPTAGDPDDPSLSPLLIFTLVFGEVAGLKLMALMLLLTGTLAMYYFLRRWYSYTVAGAVFASAVLCSCTWFPIRFLGGNINEMYYYLFPLVLYIFELYVNNGRKYLILLAAVLALLVFDGKFVFPSTILFLCIYSFIRSAGRKDGKFCVNYAYPKKAVVAAIFAVLLGAVKIVLVLDLFSIQGSMMYPVVKIHGKVYSADTIKAMNVNKLSNIACIDKTEIFKTENLSCHVGIIPVLITLLSLFLYKKVYHWVILLVPAFMLSAAWTLPVDIFKPLWHLPWMNAMTMPAKYFNFFIVFSISAISGAGVSYFSGKVSEVISKEIVNAILGVVFVLSIIPLMSFTYEYFNATEFVAPPEPAHGGEFYHAALLDKRDSVYLYDNTCKNVGTKNWYGPVLLQEYVVPKMFYKITGESVEKIVNDAYIGEAFFIEDKSQNVADITTLTANIIVVSVKIDSPGTLVLNHNYFKYWSVNKGVIQNFKGLLAVKLDTTGTYDVEFNYRNVKATIGFVVSGLAFIFLLITKYYQKPK
ncbi:MAG: hypothetical protein WC955_01075 [Elusimicrobiota bacterium]